MDTVMNRELLEELEALGDQGLFYKMLDVLQDYVEDGEDQGRFTREAAEGDLELALWVAYADLNIDEYESYYQAIRWLERVRGAAFGSGVWYYRLASAYIYTGQLQKARETAEQGAQVAPDYAWGWLNTAKLRAHFGDREGALAAVERGLALEPGDYEFTRTRAEIEAGAALDEMECHYIDPEADRQLQTDPELLAEKRQSVRCILCDEENLAAVKAALGAQTWEFEAPYCYCTLPYQGGELSARFDMNEAGVSKFTAAWAAQLAARLAELDGMAAALVAEKHPGARLELGHVVFQRSGGVLLGYHVGKSREERLYAYAAFGADLAPVGGVTYRDYTGDENEEEGDWADGSGQEDEWQPPEVYGERELGLLEAHIEKYFGRFDEVFHELVSPDIHVDVYVIAPTPQRNYYTLVTGGMGAHRMNIPPELARYNVDRAEMLLRLPPDWQFREKDEKWYWPIRWLKLLARLPLEQDTWLGWGHTVPNGRPFAANTLLSGVLLTAPEGVPKEGSACPMPDGSEVNFYQVLPLYDEEMDYKLDHDAAALLERMEAKGALACPYIRLERPNACADEQPDPPVDPAFLEQLAAWHEDCEYEKIVEAIEAVPPQERGYVLTGQLARALNNLERYAEAAELLLATKKRGRSDPLWHFRLGYAYYYMDQEVKALPEFERADELSPGDEDTETFLRWCRSAIALPVSVKPFKARVEQFWAAFAKKEAALRELWRAEGPDAAAKELAGLLKIAFSAMPFSLAALSDGRQCVLLSAEGRANRLFRLLFWRDAAPAELAEHWEFKVECPPCEGDGEDAPQEADERAIFYTNYRCTPAEGEDWLLRQDVIAGNSCCQSLVRAYYQGDDSIMDEELADGAVCGFLFYASGSLPEAELVEFRGRIEEELAGRGAAFLQVLGGAVGFQYSYIDCIAFDLKEFLDRAGEILNRFELPEIGFHVFRVECGGVNMKAEPEDGEPEED